MPPFLPTIFVITTLGPLSIFLLAFPHNVPWQRKPFPLAFMVGGLWLVLQAYLVREGIYEPAPDQWPPKLVLFGILPTWLLLIGLLVSPAGRRWLRALDGKKLMWLQVIRIPVELCLYGLWLEKLVPVEMTFAGRNWDIIVGFSAPLVAHFGFAGSRPKRWWWIWWLASLALLLNIVVTAFLSAPSPVQQFGFGQPNVAIFQFPYVWLPTFIVPVVMLSHAAMAVRWWNADKTN